MRAILLTLLVFCTAGSQCSLGGDEVFIQISLADKSVFTDAIHLGGGSYISSDSCLQGIWPEDTGLLPVDPDKLDILIYDPHVIQYFLLETDPAEFIESLGDPVDTCSINLASPRGYIRYTSNYSSSGYSTMSGLFTGFAVVLPTVYVLAENDFDWHSVPWNQGFWAIGCTVLFLVLRQLYIDIAKPAADSHNAFVKTASESIAKFSEEAVKRTELDRERLDEQKLVASSLASISTKLETSCKYHS